MLTRDHFTVHYYSSAVEPITIPNTMFVGQCSQLKHFVDNINSLMRCRTPNCQGKPKCMHSL